MLERFSRKRPGLPKNATYRLTQDGREKMQSGSVSPETRILIALDVIGSSADVEEIAGYSGLSKGAVEKYLLKLLQQQYVQRSGAAGGDVPA